MVSLKKESTVFISQTAECLEQEINLHIKDITKTMSHITKCRAFQVHVDVENIENLDVGWCLYLCVCVCVYVVSLAALRVRFPVWSGGLIVSLYGRNEAGANDTLSCPRGATRTSQPNLTKPNLTHPNLPQTNFT